MTCRKEAGGCGYEFCWICMGEWKVHGGDFYNCNKFDPKKKDNEEKNVKKVKFELERYVFYFNRYMAHQKSLQFGVKMRSTIQDVMKSFILQKNLPYEELKYLETAVEAIIKSHTALKNTYIFGYYLKDVPQRNLFEHNQFLLEKEADVLHEDMEGEELKQLLREDNLEKFNTHWNRFKGNVVNLSSVNLKNVVNDIEMTLMEHVDYKAMNMK